MTSFSFLVDQAGNPCAGTFGAPLPTSNILGASTGVSAGIPLGGLNPAGNLTPFAVDPSGSLTTRPAQLLTHATSSVGVVGTGTGAGKNMLTVLNGSTTVTQRIVALFASCPPQVNTQGGLLGIGSGTSYTPIIFGTYRITGHSGGTVLSPMAPDPADDGGIDANFSVRAGSTVTGLSAGPTFAWDAAYNGALPIAGRLDAMAKLITLPPGVGLCVRNMYALGTNVSFLLNVVCVQSAT